MTTTTMPQDIDDIRHALAAQTGSPLADIGSEPDPSHKATGGYHCGAFDLRAINAVANDDYSIRQTRDRRRYNADLSAGRNQSSAIDYPNAWPNGGDGAWIRFNNLLRHQLGIGDADLAAVRAINYTPDGATKRRFDTLTMTETSTTDTVLWHTHIELWRDLEGAVQRRWAKDKLTAIAHSAITGAPLDVPIALPPVINYQGDEMLLTCTDGSGTEKSVNGFSVPANGRIVITPAGPWSVASAGNFDSTYWKNTLWLTWAEIKDLCSKMAQPLTLSADQLAGVETAAHSGAAAAVEGATGSITLHAPTA
jgi:hypothetical protein